MFIFAFPSWDTDLFIYLNGLHSGWLDPLMLALSSSTLWIPFYLMLALLMVCQKKWQGGLALLFIGLGFGMADQLSVILFKNVFLRLRPCYELSLQAVIHSIETCGGQYGFISNHAANTFCLATFVALFFRNRLLGYGVYAWAAAVSYSRIYVGKHYPLDVFCGALFGMLCGLIAYCLYAKCVLLIMRYKQEKKQGEQVE